MVQNRQNNSDTTTLHQPVEQNLHGYASCDMQTSSHSGAGSRQGTQASPSPAVESSPYSGSSRGGGSISEWQADAINTLSRSIEYHGKSRIATLRTLPYERKWPYFRDQLLARTVAIIASVIVGIYLAVQILTPTAAPQLTVAIIQGALDEQDGTSLQAQVASALGLPQGREGGVTITTGFNLNDNNSLTKLQTMLSADEVDVIIASEGDFERLAGFGYFTALNSALTETQQIRLRDSFASFNGYDDSQETNIDYDGTSKGHSKPYGLKLVNAARWTALQSADANVLAGLVLESKNTARAQQFIDYLTNS